MCTPGAGRDGDLVTGKGSCLLVNGKSGYCNQKKEKDMLKSRKTTTKQMVITGMHSGDTHANE